MMHDMETDTFSQAARLRQARIDKGIKTADEAANRFGWNRHSYAQHENGTRGYQRSLRNYARAYGVSETWLWFGSGQKEAAIDGLPVVGTICAGSWLDTTLIDEDYSAIETIPVAPDARFLRAKQYALLVQGDSMDKEFPDGSFVVCVDYDESGLKKRNDMIVHVEQWRDDLREITLKALRSDGQDWWLEPRSNNPAHKPIYMDGQAKEGHQIKIRGVVIGDYRRRSF